MAPAPARSGRSRWGWLVPVAAVAVGAFTALVDPVPLQVLRNATFDQYQRWRPRTYQQAPVRIVDIDDESLRRLGQWPWPRTRMAELVTALHEMQAASVAFDVVFAEPDRTSPRALLAEAPLPRAVAREIAALPDHDAVFADALAGRNVALGFALTSGQTGGAPTAPVAPLAMKARYAMAGGSPLPYLHAFSARVPSLAQLQAAADGSGALTFVPDADGVVRKVPLLMRLGEDILPSLSAEALRLAEGARNYTVRTDPGGAGLIELRIGRHLVPVTERGEVWVHYTRPEPARYVPAWKVLARAVPESEIAGRIVLVGTSAQGLMDLRFSPLGGVVPGVEIHAQALEQMLLGQHLVRPGWAATLEILAAVLGGAVVGTVALGTGALLSMAGFAALSTLLCLAAWHAFASYGLLLDPVMPVLTLLITFVSTTVVRHMVTERRQRWVKQAFARYVSPNLVDYLVDHPSALELGGRRQRCSFVFADLAGFTTLMEKMDPTDAVAVLNEYLDRMIAIAFEHQGTLDRIVGDSVAIMFSAPVVQADHAQRALDCALAMQRFARAYVQDLAAKGTPFCATRIGVHTGEVIVGNFGGTTIFDYRALGDPVNIASRLEGANKHLGTLICVSEDTLAGCAASVARPIGRLRLAGRSEPVMAYEPVDPLLGIGPDTDYQAAFQRMASGCHQALDTFVQLASRRPDDPLVQLHLRRLQAGMCSDLVELASK